MAYIYPLGGNAVKKYIDAKMPKQNWECIDVTPPFKQWLQVTLKDDMKFFIFFFNWISCSRPSNGNDKMYLCVTSEKVFDRSVQVPS